MTTPMMNPSRKLDILILGGGPAGGTAALYAARIGRQVTLLTGNPAGSLIAGAREIDNYPGFPRLSGPDFIRNLHRQCVDAGVTLINEHAVELEVENRRKLVKTDSGAVFSAPALIVAVGTVPVRPAIPGLDRFWGKGVSVCAWCDGALFQGKPVAVFGGGNTAYSSVELMSRLASNVTLLLPKRSGTAFNALREKAMTGTNVSVQSPVEVLALEGNQTLQQVHYRIDEEVKTLNLAGFFLALGQKPAAGFLKSRLDMDPAGYVIADSQGSTSVPGVFAAGDIVHGHFRQLVTACGSGATAALSAEQYLSAQWE